MSTSQALVKDLEGEVSVTRNGEVVNIKVGDYLLPGDQVVTGDSGRLGLEFPGIEGQEPAAGVMTPNGKIVLGEQDSPNGPQMLVLEETECFEFTTELTEMSSVAQDTGASGLFGGLAGSGGGLLTSALGALATGLFVGGSSDNDNKDADIPAPSNDGGFGVSGGESLPAALAPVVGEDTPVGEVTGQVVNAINDMSAGFPPITKPITDAAGIDTTGAVSNGSSGNTTSGPTGSANSGPVGQVLNPINESPLGVVTQPVTDAIVGQIPEGTSSGADTVPGSSSDQSPADLGPDNIIQAVQETVAGLQEGPGSATPEGTVQNLLEAIKQDLTEVASAGETNPISTLVDTVVEGAVGGINQTPLGEPLSPLTEPAQSLTDTFDSFDLNSLINTAGGEGLVTTVVDTVGEVIEPVTAQVEPLATVVDTLHNTAVTVDSVLAETLGSVENLLGGADILGAGAGGLSPDSLSPDSLSPESLSLDAIPQTLEEATGGLLGTVESLTAQLQSGGVEDPTGGLLDTVVSTISSTAADSSSSDLSSALSKVLGGLG
ncbi:MAG: hypothetical protein QE278_06515 [Limnobacter sp.]|nr:hypothetical protein [Limnobacter sp.]